jgi:hypothetical protein
MGADTPRVPATGFICPDAAHVQETDEEEILCSITGHSQALLLLLMISYCFSGILGLGV